MRCPRGSLTWTVRVQYLQEAKGRSDGLTLDSFLSAWEQGQSEGVRFVAPSKSTVPIPPFPTKTDVGIAGGSWMRGS